MSLLLSLSFLFFSRLRNRVCEGSLKLKSDLRIWILKHSILNRLWSNFSQSPANLLASYLPWPLREWNQCPARHIPCFIARLWSLMLRFHIISLIVAGSRFSTRYAWISPQTTLPSLFCKVLEVGTEWSYVRGLNWFFVKLHTSVCRSLPFPFALNLKFESHESRAKTTDMAAEVQLVISQVSTGSSVISLYSLLLSLVARDIYPVFGSVDSGLNSSNQIQMIPRNLQRLPDFFSLLNELT